MADRALTKLRRKHIGFVFQAFNLVPTLTAIENITLPNSLAGTKPEAGWLESVVKTTGLGDRLTHRPSELSGGQQQRVAVARALASQPAIIFADEPTGNLDSRSGAEILDFMRRAVRERLSAGDSDTQVFDFMVARYGDYVLLKPPFKLGTLLLWLGAPLVLLIAAAALAFFGRSVVGVWSPEEHRRSGCTIGQPGLGYDPGARDRSWGRSPLSPASGR
jgi:hypothetical protein